LIDKVFYNLYFKIVVLFVKLLETHPNFLSEVSKILNLMSSVIKLKLFTRDIFFNLFNSYCLQNFRSDKKGAIYNMFLTKLQFKNWSEFATLIGLLLSLHFVYCHFPPETILNLYNCFFEISQFLCRVILEIILRS